MIQNELMLGNVILYGDQPQIVCGLRTEYPKDEGPVYSTDGKKIYNAASGVDPYLLTDDVLHAIGFDVKDQRMKNEAGISVFKSTDGEVEGYVMCYDGDYTPVVKYLHDFQNQLLFMYKSRLVINLELLPGQERAAKKESAILEDRSRVTPNNITSLGENEVFVFGSNRSGFHGAGAAARAVAFGAVRGQGVGMMVKTYAIPTKDFNVRTTLPINMIKQFVDEFIHYASCVDWKTFLVTKIGCGLAGHKVEDIAILFKKAIPHKNIHLPEEFWAVLNNMPEEPSLF